MMVYSDTFKRWYEDSGCVFFRNPVQSAYYLFKCPEGLIDIFATDDLKMVYVFSRECHDELKNEWRDRPHDVPEKE